MRTLIPLSILLLLPSVSSQGALSNVAQYFFPNFKTKSAESTAATLAELGIGDGAHDSSKIIKVTDSNWEEYWGPEQTGEWLVEFTASPEHCGTCELVDLAFNVAIFIFVLTDSTRMHRIHLLQRSRTCILDELTVPAKSFFRLDSSSPSRQLYIISHPQLERFDVFHHTSGDPPRSSIFMTKPTGERLLHGMAF